MNSIPKGDWVIECVVINETTVMNNDNIRGLEILSGEWVIQPANQRFKVIQQTADSAVLESKGETYYAEFEINASRLSLTMSRPNIKETVRIEAEAVTADVFVSMN